MTEVEVGKEEGFWECGKRRFVPWVRRPVVGQAPLVAAADAAAGR